MLVIASQADALLEAARLLSDDDRVAQLRTSSYHVSVGESDTFLAEELSNSGNYLLKDILEQGITLTGPFHQETSITLPVSSDYTLSSQGKMVFELRYSENLDFDRSLVTVYWGTDRIPLASSKLSADQASGHTLSFTIPADAVGSEGNVIVIAFELEVKDLDCTPRQIDMPWAYISENSAVYLPESDQASLSLGNWPAPFQRNGRLNNVLVVIPDAPTASDLILLGRTMTAVGTNSDAYGTLRVITASNFQTSDAQANLIVIGMGAKNTLFSNINTQLLFQYDTLQSEFLSNDKVIFSNSYASEVGSIQLLVSPFDEDYSLLAITAPQQSGLDALTEVMSNPTLQWGLDREVALVDSMLEMSTYQFTYSSIATSERPSIVDTVVENQDSLIFALIGLGTMLLLLIGALIVLLNARRRNKKID